MRCAFAEALIAEQLSNYIFVDFYAASENMLSMDPTGLVKALDSIDESHPLPAAIIRWQLARVFAESDRALKDSMLMVCTTLKPWLASDDLDPARENSFAFRLQQCFSEAIALWKPLQRTRRRVKANNHSLWADDSEELEDECWRLKYDDVSPQVQEQLDNTTVRIKDGAVAVLFPQIIMTESEVKDGEKTSPSDEYVPLFRGYVLCGEQSSVIAAVTERSSHKRASRRGSDHSRREHRRGTSELERPHGSGGGGGAEQPPPTRRMSTSSAREIHGSFNPARSSTAGVASDSERASLRSARTRADPNASAVSSARSHRSGSSVGGQGGRS